jgi:polysaccharide biosynthesis protein PslH
VACSENQEPYFALVGVTVRILFVVPNPPSLVRVRPYNLVRGLQAHGHQVTVATLWTNPDEQADISRLTSQGIPVITARLGRIQVLRNLLSAVATGLPLQATYCQTPALGQALLAAYPEFDVVHVEHLRAARYGLRLKAADNGMKRTGSQPTSPAGRAPSLGDGQSLPVVWDSVDCISHLFEQALAYSRSPFGRLVAWLDLGRTRRYEGWLIGQFDRVLVTSPLDQVALEQLALAQSSVSQGTPANAVSPSGNRDRTPVTVLPNGVDLAYFVPDDTPREPATVLFSGKMSYHANVTAALHLVNEIMPRVWAQCPTARVVIAGKDPPRSLQDLASRNGQIVVTGTVPDIRPYLRSATVAVSPLLYGAGIQNKVLEALACATAVVASPLAVSALHTSEGEQLLAAADAEAFAQRILEVFADPELARRLGTAGRRYVEEHHNWDVISGSLSDMYQWVIDRRKHLD